jgi:hypothetical protein
MTDKELNKLADFISKRIIKEMNKMFQFSEHDPEEAEEQKLLAELATAMTELDYNLEKENYAQFERLKNKIYVIENKLNKFK